MNPRLARMRKERIRGQKHAEKHARVMEQKGLYDFEEDDFEEDGIAEERFQYDIVTLLKGEEVDSDEDFNKRLWDITQGQEVHQTAVALMSDSPKWMAQHLAYDALEEESETESLRLARKALDLDSNCTDAAVIVASLLVMDGESRVLQMSEIVDRAERDMSEEFIAENKGHFWEAVLTRPYMRAKYQLANLLVLMGQFQEAIYHYAHMLRLNPDDHFGIRPVLLWLYLAVRRSKEAAVQLQDLELTDSGTGAWANVMERWLSSDFAEAEEALTEARLCNRYFESYLNGSRELPKEAFRQYEIKGESEALAVVAHAGPALNAHPGFREWLRGQPPQKR